MLSQSDDAAITAPPGASSRRRFARFVTEMLAPAPVAALLALLVAWRSAPNPGDALRWGLLAAAFISLIPSLFVLRGVRGRQLTDHHLGAREQRPVPLLVALASTLVGLAVLAIGGAPRELVAVLEVVVVSLAISILITLVWKVSLHALLLSAAVVILATVLGPLLFALAPLVALVGWARIELGAHSPAQVLTGAGLGAIVAALVLAWAI